MEIDLAYIDESAVKKNFGNTHDHAVYKATEVDAAIAELKAENRKLKRALWLARAERAKEMCQRLLIQGFDPKWEKVERKCRSKAEEYK